MKKAIYSAKNFGFVGDEYFSKEDENIMMDVIKLNAQKFSKSLDEPVFIKILEV